MLRPRERGQCSPRNRAGTEAPASREGSGLGAEPPGFSPLPPFPLWPASLFLFFFSRLYYYFFPFSAKQKFCPQSQAAGCGGFFSLPKPRRAKPPERRCPEGSGGRQEKNSVLRLRALWRGSQGPQPFCTLSTSASSARVSAQPRYCFHMFLQETSGVRSLVGMLTGYRNACE